MHTHTHTHTQRQFCQWSLIFPKHLTNKELREVDLDDVCELGKHVELTCSTWINRSIKDALIRQGQTHTSMNTTTRWIKSIATRSHFEQYIRQFMSYNQQYEHQNQVW